MRFTRLTLHNFGIYRGKHELDLETGHARGSIVLVGALNGSGKTTILEAIQVALYGSRSPFLDGATGGYSGYIKDVVNRYAREMEAAVELSFVGEVDGRFGEYSVFRRWRVASKVKEDVQVLRYGVCDPILSDMWDDLIEELLPSKVAELFFFDGERIESLADPSQSARYLKTAVNALLGLDVVKSLERDLTILEKQKRRESSGMACQQHMQVIDEKFSVVVDKKRTILECISECESKRDQNERRLQSFRQQLKDSGGDLYARREALEVKRLELKRRLSEVKALNIKEASGVLPLELVSTRFKAVGKLQDRAKQYAQALIADSALADYKSRLAAVFQQNGLDTHIGILDEALPGKDDVDVSSEPYLKLLTSNHTNSFVDFKGLLSQLNEAVSSAQARLNLEDELMSELEVIERTLAAVPSESQVKSLVESVAVTELEVQKIVNEDLLLRESLTRTEAELYKLEKERDKVLEHQIGNKDVERVLVYSERVRKSLAVFEQKLRVKNLARLEALILESFSKLMRKDSLITNVRICPETCALTLFTDGNMELSANELSAGERQLLAIAILWALKKASNRAIPMLVDTPLGRLDDTHRRLLIENYFPQVSHQVLLLSTDVEIAGEHYKNLKNWVYAEFTLAYHEEHKTSQIHEGYFSQFRKVA